MVMTGLAGTLAIAITFLISGFLKMKDPAAAGYMVQRLRLLPQRLGDVAGKVFPYIEVALAVVLLSGQIPRAATLLAALVAAGFSALSIRALIKGDDLACNCFGALIPSRLGLGTLLHAALLFLLALPAFIWPVSPLDYLRSADYMQVLLGVLPALCLVQLGFIVRLSEFDKEAAKLDDAV